MTTLRRASAADAERIATIHRAARQAYYLAGGYEPNPEFAPTAELWHRLLGEHEVSIDGSTPTEMTGFVCMKRTESVVELTALYVEPDGWDRGTGSALHDWFVERAREAGVPGELTVWSANSRAVRFYERRGWVTTDASRPGPNDAPFVTMRLPSPG